MDFAGHTKHEEKIMPQVLAINLMSNSPYLSLSNAWCYKLNDLLTFV